GLIAAASLASDAPLTRIGTVNRTALLRQLTAELGIFYADLRRALPEQPLEVREALTRLLTLRSWEGAGHNRPSLISAAASAMAAERQSDPACWTQVRAAVNCWWRVVVDDKGEEQRLLALRHDAVYQVGDRPVLI